MDNKLIAEMLDEIADMLSLEEKPTTRFEIRAYKKASLNIATMQEPIEEVYQNGGAKALMEIPGIGKGIAGNIEEFIKTGKMKKYSDLKKKYPVNMKELTSIQGIGAKKAILLYRDLKVKDIKTLKDALKLHKVKELPGFGEKSEESIEKGLAMYEAEKGRMLLGEALPEAESIIKKLTASGLVENAIVAGSSRRMRETVGDLDILAISKTPDKAMEFFAGMDNVSDVILKGPTKTTVRLKIGLNCDFRVLEPKSFGAGVQYFTGSRDHNIQVRTIAVKNGYKLNEYGLFDNNGNIITSEREESIYEELGMQWMPPEMREARGEVKLSLEHRIPRLVELGDIKGDLHSHTKETDGSNSLEEMVGAAIESGFEYLAVTNHTKSLKIARGMDDKQFIKFFEKIDRINEKVSGKITVLKGAEVDILKNGELDLSNKTLKEMDCAVCAVHSFFNMNEEEMTARVIKAMESGLVNVLAHPTGRLIKERQGYRINIEKIADAAERNNVALEINSWPDRLDLNDTNILLASKFNVMFSIDTDSHSTSNFRFIRYGVGTARRGWLKKESVVNAMGVKDLLKKFGK